MMVNHYLYFLKHNLEARLLKQRKPLLAGFKVTNRCNLQCRACPFWQKGGGDVTYAVAIEAIDRLHASGARLLIFEGGEPFLWRDEEHRLEDLVQTAAGKFFSTGITTNGLLPIETSAGSVWVSIDGLPETHDQNRGKCFDRVLANIAASSHPRILANITINKANCREIPRLVAFLDKKVKGITVQFYYPYEGTEDLSVALSDREWVLDELMRLKNEGYPVLDSYAALEALKRNTWRCHSWLIANAEPDGSVNNGCYLENRAEISCAKCGFAAHVEMSLAYDWHWEAIQAGRKIFGF